MRRVLAWLFAMVLLAGVPSVAFAEGVNQDTKTEAVEVAVEGDNTSESSLPAVGSTFAVANNTYKVTSNDPKTVAFVRSTNAKSVIVPSTVQIGEQTYLVTEIASKAFAPAKKTLERVKIGKNIKVIGTSAFAGCRNLVGVSGGSNVTIIKAKAFLGCKKLKKCVPFSSKVLVKVGKNAFKGTKKLNKLTVKSKLLKKKAVKGSLKGSSVKTIKVSVGAKNINKKYVKKYRKIFAKKNSGKKVKVK